MGGMADGYDVHDAKTRALAALEESERWVDVLHKALADMDRTLTEARAAGDRLRIDLLALRQAAEMLLAPGAGEEDRERMRKLLDELAEEEAGGG